MWASHNGHCNVAKVLLQNGADPNIGATVCNVVIIIYTCYVRMHNSNYVPIVFFFLNLVYIHNL